MPDALPDLLGPNLRVVFCGTAAGTASAARGAYYAGPGNRFWPTLFAIGLTPRQLRPDEFRLLPVFGIGLTDIAKTMSGSDDQISVGAHDRDRFIASIRTTHPEHLAFNGKKAASHFLRRPTGQIAYGPAMAFADFPPITVLPSTSGAASGYWS